MTNSNNSKARIAIRYRSVLDNDAEFEQANGLERFDRRLRQATIEVVDEHDELVDARPR